VKKEEKKQKFSQAKKSKNEKAKKNPKISD